MKLYKQLQLQPDQRTCMAERWRSWCRRRDALGHHLASALARFQAAYPPDVAFLTSVDRCATLVATFAEQETPVDTADQGTALPEADVSELRMHAQNASQPAFRTSVIAVLNAKDVLSDITSQANERSVQSDTMHTCDHPDSESCIAVCATALHKIHCTLADSRTDSSSSGNEKPLNRLQKMDHSEYMHSADTRMAAAYEPHTANLVIAASAELRDQSSMPLWSQSTSRLSSDAEDLPMQDSFAHCQHEDMRMSPLERAPKPSRTEASASAAGGASLDERHCMHVQHRSTSSELKMAATAPMSHMHASCSSAAASAAYTFCACMLCGTQMCNSPAVDAQSTGNYVPFMHGGQNVWVSCIVCGKGHRRLLLGESGEVAKAAYDALGSLLDVHTSDALMHYEFIGPFWELSEKQQAVLLACAIDLRQPAADMMTLWQRAEEEERRDALFGHLKSFSL